MLAIRMRRLGAKKRPFYRVVVIDSHKARDGRALEVLGHYNPTTVPETFKIDQERFDHWLARGAQPSDTLRTLLTRPQAEEAVVVGDPPPPLLLRSQCLRRWHLLARRRTMGRRRARQPKPARQAPKVRVLWRSRSAPMRNLPARTRSPPTRESL